MNFSLCLLLATIPAAEPDKPDIPRLLAQLKDGDVVAQNKAAQELAKLGKPAVPGLVEALQSNKDGVPARAARALRQIGPSAKDAVPALVERINKNKGRSVDDAESIEALMQIASRTPEALPGLRAILCEPPRNPSRTHAAIALGKMGPMAKEAVPELVKLLEEAPGKSGPIRFHAAAALGQIGSDAKEAVPALVKLLGDKSAGTGRRMVIVALGQMGPAAKDAVTALKEARDEPALRESADKALAKIQGQR
jgi:HEAT repeat protein